MSPGADYTAIAVVFYCHDGKGNFVMDLRGPNCRDEQGKWEIGGGRLHFGEKVEDAIRREVQEEYCTEVVSMEYLGFREVFREQDGAPTHWVSLDFSVLVKPELVANGEPDKHEKVKWFTRETIPKNVHSQFPVFLEKYRENI